MFRIELDGGFSFDFAGSNPFYILNSERAYRSEYDLCQELSNT